MLRRNNSNRLSRSKSTSSVHSKHEPIDPVVARQHAHTAAMLAFVRAQERNSADVGHSGGAPSQINPRVVPDRQPLSQQTSSANIDRVIKRQHSVRFAGPNSVQRRQSIGTRAAYYPRQESSSANVRPIAITTNAAVPAAYRPPSRSSSIGKASTSKTGAENSFAAAPYDEYYIHEEEAPSTPSSYRRLRRSKSMFSPLKAPSVFYTNGTPDRPESSYLGCQNSISCSRTPQTPPARAALRAPKSMSFLRGGRARATFERNDEAVQLARDRFFRETAQQRLREQPSFLFRSKAQRQDKPFRKSVRTSSASGYGVPISSGTQSDPSTESSLKDVARRASKTIKNKFRQVFSRSKEEPVTVPNQQIDARETHVRKYNGDPDVIYQDFSDIPRPDEAAISRVVSRIPSIHTANSNQHLRSYAGSVKSMKSSKSANSDETSRVTSWNSTGVNTIISQNARPHIDREQQRLSIINENGTHVPSSSFSRPKLVNQFSAYPVVHRPSKSAGHVPAPGPALVDSARVYSALMKRLDENSPKARLEASHKASMESFAATNRVPLRSNSVGSCRGNRTPATIRHVLPEHSTRSGQSRGPDQHDHHWTKADSVHSARAEDIFGSTGIHVHQWVAADSLREARMKNSDDVFSPKDDSNNKENRIIEQPQERGQSSASASVLSRQASTKTSYHTVPENYGLTPQELAARNEPVVQGTKYLREARSTFFGGTTFTMARATSPFRRAMAEGEYNPAGATNAVLRPGHTSPLRNPLYLGPEASVPVDAIPDAASESDKAYSESIYSRTTSGQTPADANSALSLAISHEEVPEIPFPRTSTGDVVIIDRTTYRPVMPSGGSHRVTNSSGSIDWKKWMSSEVAKLERSKENAQTSYVNYAMPTMPRSFHAGHVREPAQINDDDVEVSQEKVFAVKQPLGLVQRQNPNIPSAPLLKPILKNRSAVSLVESVEMPNGGNPAIPIPPPPPIPVRSPLRPVPSKSSLRSEATVNISRTTSAPNSAAKISSLGGRNLLHKRHGSQTTLHSTKSASIKNVETPAKLVKRTGRPSNTSTPSPGGMLIAAVDRQLGSTSISRYRTPGVTNSENIKEEKDDIYGIEGAGILGPKVNTADLEAQALGSKRMVELFLSSRRRRIAGGSEESGVFL